MDGNIEPCVPCPCLLRFTGLERYHLILMNLQVRICHYDAKSYGVYFGRENHTVEQKHLEFQILNFATLA